MLNYTQNLKIYSRSLNYSGTPCQAPTPTQEGASPSGFYSAPTKHSWSLQKR